MAKVAAIASAFVCCALSSGASADLTERFWSAPEGRAWTNNTGECWQSQNGPSDVRPCAATDIIESLTIELVNDEFDFDSAAIKPEMAVALDGVARAVRDSSGDEILTIVGHTDAKGTEAYNYDLGLRRAQATKDYLVGVGIPASRMRVASAGKLEPIAPNDTEAGRARNRRIEIRSDAYMAGGAPSQGSRARQVDLDIQ